MSKDGLIVYSSITGNTKLLAEGIHKEFSHIADLFPISQAPSPESYRWILFGFWVNRGTADVKTLELLDSFTHKSIGYFGTLGAYPDSDHANKVRGTMNELISYKNTYLGGFLCQGKINSKITEKFKNTKGDHTHKITPERLKRHKDAESHPDEKDIINCINACEEMISKHSNKFIIKGI